MATRNVKACWKCKARGVKCPGGKPSCSNCIRLGYECQYGLKLMWREDAVARGICFGREGVYKPSRKSNAIPPTAIPPTSLLPQAVPSGTLPTRDYLFINTSYKSSHDSRDRPRRWSFELEHCDSLISHYTVEGDIVENDEMVNIPSYTEPLDSSRLWVNPSPYKNLEPSDFYYFDYFSNRICPNLSITVNYNPYSQFLIPLAFTSAPLLHVILSTSAAELYHITKDPRYERASMMYKIRALRGLRCDIQAGTENPERREQISGSIATVLMLCFLEITDECSPIWMTHLKAGYNLCNMVLSGETRLDQDFRRFCVMYFVAHEVMSRTAYLQQIIFEPSEWWAEDEETEVDTLMGCSRGLMHQVSAISTLILDVRENWCQESTSAFLHRRDAIESALYSLRQHLPSHSSSSELLAIAETKRLSALIYFYTCIDHATPSSLSIMNLTAHVIKHLRALPAKSTLIFALFVVGTLGVRTEEDRRLVLDVFANLIRVRPLASIVRALSVVKAVWVDRDLGKCDRWEGLVEGRGGLLSLA